MINLDGDGISFWWYVIGAVVLVIWLKGRDGGGAFIHVPDGENWRRVYRERVLNPQKDKPNMSSRLVMGVGIGIAIAAVMWALQ